MEKARAFGVRLGLRWQPRVRQYNFGSSQYMACFGGLPVADGAQLRADTIAYMDSFDGEAWLCGAGE